MLPLAFLFGRPAPAPQSRDLSYSPPPGKPITWQPASPAVREELLRALRETQLSGRGIRMNAKDTSFSGLDDRDSETLSAEPVDAEVVDAEVFDAEVVDAVKSIPSHYAG